MLIGVWLVTIIVTLGATAQGFVADETHRSFGLSGVAALTLGDTAGDPEGPRALTARELNWLRRRATELGLPHAAEVTLAQTSLRLGDQVEFGSVVAVTDDIGAVRDFRLVAGRALTHSDISNNRRVAVVSGALLRRLKVTPESLLGASARSGPEPSDIYSVVGVLVPSLTGDNGLYVPNGSEARRAQRDRPGEVEFLVNTSGAEQAAVVALLQNEFATAFPDRSLVAAGADPAAREVARLSNAFVAVLALLAAAALVVGTLAIASVMSISVRQRESEVGIRRAFGARASDIYKLFLAEASFLAFTGGVCGVYLGLLVVVTATRVARIAFDVPIQLVIPATVLWTAVVITVALGVVAGLLPARTAARLDVIAALRDE
ncbi:MAG: ABC transporter permease [Actinobacteria bacterium]|nr:ABC transporter permease [Actinomycetota bacterium]